MIFKKSVFETKSNCNFLFLMILLFFILNIVSFSAGGTYFVPPNMYYIIPDNVGKLILQNPQDGSILILQTGFTFTDINVTWDGKDDIILRSENNGGANFAGDTRFSIKNSTKISIEGIIFNDIVWDYPDVESMGFKFYNSENCEIYNCAFISCGADTTNGNGIIYIVDKCNDISIAGCYFEDIKSKAIQVWLPNNSTSPNTNIHIYANYFKDITEGFDYVQEAGWTGNKAIMLGSGYVTTSHSNMNAIVENNLFENCIGDGEIISNKANGNLIEGNTFINNRVPNELFNPRVELRHGDNSIIRNNVFINTATGLVVHGDNHKIYNNYIEDADIGIRVPGSNSSHPNSSDCYIVNNTIVNSKKYGIRFGSAYYNIPNTNFIYNNLLHYNPVVCTTAIKYFDGVTGACENQDWEMNYVTTLSSDCSNSFYTSGITYVREDHVDMNTNSNDNLYRLSSTSNARNNAYTTNLSFLLRDLDYELRSDIDIGADEYSSLNHNIVLTPNDVGVSYSLSKIGYQANNQNYSNHVVSEYQLLQNYPNPFNPSTQISYQIPKDGFVNLVVYNALGQMVSELVNKHQTSGKYSVQFNATNLPSGVYFYKIESSEFSKINKMLLLK